ncbi:MAG: sodium:proton antiporter [Alphaproteobacteria bacterium]|nr:sodium:proton antiporter [Alphaproteobacteria bacterium]
MRVTIAGRSQMMWQALLAGKAVVKYMAKDMAKDMDKDIGRDEGQNVITSFAMKVASAMPTHGLIETPTPSQRIASAMILKMLCGLGGLLLATAAKGETMNSTLLIDNYFSSNPSGGLWWWLPFGGLLLCLGLMPLFFRHLWDKHFDKITLFWLAITLLPLLIFFGWRETGGVLLVMLLHDYLPFLILLTALFVMAGGIVIKGYFDGRPSRNLQLLLLGTLLASFMGTMGASMLLVRPCLRALKRRRHHAPMLVFFIILVGNVGGALTPLGDPPLLLGLLRGIDFFWPLQHIWAPFLLLAGGLLLLFYLVDSYCWRREGLHMVHANRASEPLTIAGSHNFIFLLITMGVLLATTGGDHGAGGVFGLAPMAIIRDVVFILLALLSYLTTSKTIHQANAFNLAPAKEIAILFLGIFITLLPVMKLLAGATGQTLAQHALTNDAGGHNPVAYFWFTGLFSSLLDNAPTYLLFFQLAGGDPQWLMTSGAKILLAISMGAVFMGANSYIGNAPNMVVRTLADSYRLRVPHFFAYSFYAAIILVPFYLLLSFLFLGLGL